MRTNDTVLGSKWSGLHKSLLAQLFPVNQQGVQEQGPTVIAPITDANIELVANWQSPFENYGIEAKIPAIAAMFQSGTLSAQAETLLGKGTSSGLLDRLRTEIQNFAAEGYGRSGLTKLNSTQVFTGAPPVKISMTMHFRAFDDPRAEVQEPIDQLAQWHLSRQLAANGSLVEAIVKFNAGDGFLKSLLPSTAPRMVGMRFGGYLFSPMVIESISRPLTVPRSKDGEPLSTAVQITLSTLTALDTDDWARSRKGQPTKMFNNT
jgi:hypothetical protein